MKKIHLLMIAALVMMGVAGGFFSARLLGTDSVSIAEPATNAPRDSQEREIAYWVAPMDPNYRRAEPGLSPMGMELVAVYAGAERGAGEGEPALQISPAVVNSIGVRSEAVRRADLALNIRTVGHVMADEEKQSDIHTRSEGWIEVLSVEAEGEAVRRGELLFQIYSPALVAAQSEYLQSMRLARPALQTAATERLAALGMGEQQIAQLRESGAVNRRVGVYAPQSGVVTALNVREGMFVRPSDMTVSLADLSTIWVFAEIFETQADWVAPRQRAVMTLPAFPGEAWEGEVDYVYPTVQTQTRTIRVRLRFPNPEMRLKPNMFADIVIDAAPREGVLIIPQSALIRTSQGERVILALGDGRFRPAQVRAGVESGDEVEILSGLEVGERVVTSSQFLIDSEASLNAALLRMTAAEGMEMNAPAAANEGNAPAMGNMDMPAANNPAVSAVGRVQSVDHAERSIILDHDPIPELNWPSMTMGFLATENVDLDNLEEGAAIRFKFRQSENGFEVLSVEPLSPEATMGNDP
jgi:Cu(I)/Ag(I) efflux system membrane fusion protein